MNSNLILNARNLLKNYGSIRAVDGLSLEIRRGEIFGFLGPNGAGKTTSIKMLCGLLKPDRGTIEINTRGLSRSVGVCPQNIVVWENLTCLEQLRFMGEMYNLTTATAKRKSLELLEVFGLTENKNKFAKALSGGMQRRLNIALALVHEPEIVILDEPHAGLDPQSRILVRDFIKSIKNTTTVILTTHDMEEAEKLSDRVCIIDHGKVLITGTVEEIKSQSGEGDLCEITIEGDVRTELLPFLNNGIIEKAGVLDNLLSFPVLDMRESAEHILSVIKTKKIKLKDFRVRNKSLEDVFIYLTGRGLRG